MNQNSIFQILLEVNSVKLYDPHQATNTCPLGLSFRFPGLVDLEIREGEFCGHTAAGGNEVRMTKGLSCLFMVDPANVFQTVRQFYADVGVYRYVTGGPEVRLVAQTRIEFNRTFTELIEMPDQPDRTRELNRTLYLYEMDRPNPVGTMNVHVKLVSLGTMLITEFKRDPTTKKFLYNGVDYYSPVDNGTSERKCSEETHDRDRQRGHKNKARQTEEEQECKSDKARCGKKKMYMDQLERTMRVMRMMKQLFQAAVEVPSDVDRAKVGQPCVFDQQCPIANCPFRYDVSPSEAEGEELVSSTPELDRLTRAPLAWKSNDDAHTQSKPPTVDYIEDDADLFIVGVGRVDPCQIKEPVYRVIETQYSMSDISTSFMPPVPEPQPVEKNDKKSKKDKKGKKGKKGKK